MKKSIVLKLGGKTIEEDGVVEELVADLKALPKFSPIVVHGGGSEIGRYLKQMGKEFSFIQGL